MTIHNTTWHSIVMTFIHGEEVLFTLLALNPLLDRCNPDVFDEIGSST